MIMVVNATVVIRSDSECGQISIGLRLKFDSIVAASTAAIGGRNLDGFRLKSDQNPVMIR